MSLTVSRDHARQIVGAIPDPEMPQVTLDDLGMVRSVAFDPDGTLIVELTPTYAACPALAEMKYAINQSLRAAGFLNVAMRTVLDPPWTTDWITPAGRRKLQEAGIAPPGRAGIAPSGIAPPGRSGSAPTGIAPPGRAGSAPPGRAGIAPSGIAPPGRAGSAPPGSVPPGIAPMSDIDSDISGEMGNTVAIMLARSSARTVVACPRCGSDQTELISRFSGTACKSLHRCRDCTEPFEHIRPI